MSVLWFAAIVAGAVPNSQAPQTPQPQTRHEILVTGKGLADTQKELAACLARACPPREDIDASLAHAENLFVGGSYRISQKVLAASIRRNKRYRATLPVDVADLMRAWSRVSAHRGQEIQARHGMYGVVDSMRAGLTPEDSRLLGGRLELAGNFARNGRVRLAQEQFSAVASDARRLGNRKMEGYAIAQHALLLAMLTRIDRNYGPQARQLLQQLSTSEVPEHRAFGAVARLTAARMAVRRGDADGIDALVADYQATDGSSTSPTLIYSDPIELRNNLKERLPGRTRRMAAKDASDPDWVDIAFLIDGKGRTREVEVLRVSDAYRNGWATSIVKSIVTRRYTPPSTNSDLMAMRVERYTRTRPLIFETGSRMMVLGPPTVRMVDLSDTPTAPRMVSN